MSQQELVSVVSELQELRRMQEELEAEITASQDRIKAYMTMIDAEQLIAGSFKVTWKAVTSSRVDATALKKSPSPVGLTRTRRLRLSTLVCERSA